MGGLGSSIFVLFLADAMAVEISPQAQEFACFRARFSQDSGFWSWKNQKVIGQTYFIKGSFMLGAISPVKLRLVLDGNTFEIPDEMREPGAKIRLRDITTKHGPLPDCDAP